jgi:toxin ParE1/3/4
LAKAATAPLARSFARVCDWWRSEVDAAIESGGDSSADDIDAMIDAWLRHPRRRPAKCGCACSTPRVRISRKYTLKSKSERERHAAERFVRQLNDQCRRLAPLPGTLGRARLELCHDVRSAPFKGYVIFFRYLDDDILEIVHVIEGHRDIAAIFADDGRG